MGKTREIWVDNIKIFACVLVVVGHFFQSMTASGFVPESALYLWFNKTIYYFHVPLFFICSGYLYEKYTSMNTMKEWGKNVLSKAFALGIPYFLFSIITWLLKTVFADTVNQQSQSLVISLFWNPISPYWYLFSLFFMFLLIPVMKNSIVSAIVLIGAILSKIITIVPIHIDIYILNIFLEYLIWFVFGMCLFRFNIVSFLRKKFCLPAGAVLFILFVLLSVYFGSDNEYNPFISFILGFIACVAFIVFSLHTEQFSVSKKIAGLLAGYTLPVFLMHTIFAAALRGMLGKIGIVNSAIHITAGLIISFAGPILAYMIASRVKFLDFFFYPNKYIKFIKRNRG